IPLMPQIVSEGEREPVDIRLEKGRQRRDVQNLSLREGMRQFAAYHILVVDGHERAQRNLMPDGRIASRRKTVGVADEENDRRDATPDSLFGKPDLFRNLEEFVESVEAEIDDLGNTVIDDQPIHQRHLAEGI